MERLTDPAQEKRKLLQAWVAEGENRNACESRVVISRESSNTYRGQKELVSIRDMFLVKKWPVEKIRGIVNREFQTRMHQRLQLWSNTGAPQAAPRPRRKLCGKRRRPRSQPRRLPVDLVA